MSEPLLKDGVLSANEIEVLRNVPGTVTAQTVGNGVVLRFVAEKAASRHVFPVGEVVKMTRFTACHRYEPFWMTPKAGTKTGDVPIETQFLLCENESGWLLVAPLVDGVFRCALQGSQANALELVAETGDDTLIGTEVAGLFVAAVDNTKLDLFEMISESAAAVTRYLNTGRLRREKKLPEFVDRFGWCTWDAFYSEVSQDKVREGLETFLAGGISPKYLILDDGWQSVQKFPTGESRLTSFAANSKFPGGLRPTVEMAKNEFGIETFLVWHAVVGYWGGVDGSSLPGYAVRPVSRRYSPGIDHYVPTLREWFGTACGTVDTTQVHRFYQDFHRQLREQGVDGVKIDNQASLEGLAYSGGFGGRAGLMRAYREAMEGAVQVHFDGNLINCMSCANEMIYAALASNLIRTSTDFWPNRPESHGLHLYCNAQVSLWFGEFLHPDWDMFQSGHEMGAYHAAGRAIGGCPVYVSDKPGQHNFDVLKKLVLSDGTILRCDHPGRPTRDCLFHDPTREEVLLKIWNTVGDAGMVGVFHARYEEGVTAISGTVRPSDVPGLTQVIPSGIHRGERFAVWAHYRQELKVSGATEDWPITLDPLTAEIFTLVPIFNGCAPIGIAEKFNSYKTLLRLEPDENGEWTIPLLCGGTLIAYTERKPLRVEWDLSESLTETLLEKEGEPLPTELTFDYNEQTGLLKVTVPELPLMPSVRVLLQKGV